MRGEGEDDIPWEINTILCKFRADTEKGSELKR